MDVLVINGPNLNLLGTRNPHVYGRTTLAQIEAGLVAQGREAGLDVECVQDNHEGAIIDHIQGAPARGCRFLILNAGAYSHTSVAIADALEAVELPYVEVHISNVFAREEFRHHSMLSAGAAGVLVGCGPLGYSLALTLVADRLAGGGPTAAGSQPQGAG